MSILAIGIAVWLICVGLLTLVEALMGDVKDDTKDNHRK